MLDGCVNLVALVNQCGDHRMIAGCTQRRCDIGGERGQAALPVGERSDQPPIRKGCPSNGAGGT